MRFNEILYDERTRKGVAFFIMALIVIFTLFCIVQVVKQKEQDKSRTSKPLVGMHPQVNLWGSIPKSACNVFEQQNLFTYPYEKKEGSKFYSCSTPEIPIPDAKGVKTIQYEAKGFPNKVTEYGLKLRIKNDDDQEGAVASQKVWALYTAVLLANLFSIELQEADLESLATLKAGKSFSTSYQSKLRMVARANEESGFTVYEFKAYGMPMIAN